MSLAQNVTQLAPSCTDHELVVAVRNGSDRAFEELYGRYGPRVRAYVLDMVGDHGRAEDLTQDVFIAALRRLRETNRPIAFKPWIYEIARNAGIDEFRRRRRAREVSLDASDALVETSERLLSSAPAPDAAIENKQKLDDLRGAFQGLSENHHRIMVMREFEGLSYGQIGDRMGISKPVVESTLFRARRRLHAEYDELVSGRRCEQVQQFIATTGDGRTARSLGPRRRGQLARHLAHCQPCRRTARMAGLDESFFAPGLVGKIAALLPFPWLRFRRGPRADETLVASGPHSISALRPLQAIAQLANSTGPLTGLGRAATAAAAALVVAGTGGGIVAGLDVQHPRRSLAPEHLRTAASAGAPAVHHRSARGPGRGGTARSRRGAGAVRAAGSSSSRTARRPKTSTAPRTTAPGAASTRTPSGSAPRPSAATGAAAAVSNAPATLGGSVSSATGLLSGGGSGAPALPKLPKVGLPTVQSVANALNNVQAPLAPLPKLRIPKPQLPSVSLPDPSGLIPPLGRR